MKLGRLTFTLALAGIAANMFLKKRGESAPAHPDFVDTEDSGYAGADATPEAATQSALSADAGAAGRGRESPNAAERMQAGRTSALAEAVDGTSDDLFESNSQDGPYPKTPGLPDLTRGA